MLGKPNTPMTCSTKGVATLKQKESKVIKAQLPKKRKGPTGDSIFISDTSSDESDRPSTVNNGTIQMDSEGDNEERGDIELGMSAFNTYEKEKKKGLEWYLEHLKKDWNAPIYSFFYPMPDIGYHKDHCFHEFTCAAKGYQKRIHCYLDKADAKSTGNLWKHAKKCWGVEMVEGVDRMKDVAKARHSGITSGHWNGSIMAFLGKMLRSTEP